MRWRRLLGSSWSGGGDLRWGGGAGRVVVGRPHRGGGGDVRALNRSLRDARAPSMDGWAELTAHIAVYSAHPGKRAVPSMPTSGVRARARGRRGAHRPSPTPTLSRRPAPTAGTSPPR